MVPFDRTAMMRRRRRIWPTVGEVIVAGAVLVAVAMVLGVEVTRPAGVVSGVSVIGCKDI